MRSRPADKPVAPKDVHHKDMVWLLQNVILPMRAPPAPTSFVLHENEVFGNLLRRMRSDCPTLFAKHDLGRLLNLADDSCH